METVDAMPLVEKCWRRLLKIFRESGWSAEIEALVRALGDGYPSPTILDRRPPQPGGMAAESEQDVIGGD
jgi:hypothetical protein